MQIVYVLEHRGRCYSKREGIIIPHLHLKIHDVYFVINHGEELKAKDPPSIWLCYVSTIGIVADGISCYPTHNSFTSRKYARSLK